jgi:hypothetical protein
MAAVCTFRPASQRDTDQTLPMQSTALSSTIRSRVAYS